MGDLNLFNLSTFETTVTEESPMAAAAKIGLSRIPKKKKSIPAATDIRIVRTTAIIRNQLFPIKLTFL